MITIKDVKPYLLRTKMWNQQSGKDFIYKTPI